MITVFLKLLWSFREYSADFESASSASTCAKVTSRFSLKIALEMNGKLDIADCDRENSYASWSIFASEGYPLSRINSPNFLSAAARSLTPYLFCTVAILVSKVMGGFCFFLSCFFIIVKYINKHPQPQILICTLLRLLVCFFDYFKNIVSITIHGELYLTVIAPFETGNIPYNLLTVGFIGRLFQKHLYPSRPKFKS